MPLDAIIVQHAEKEPTPGDPGLTPLGHDQARRVGVLLLGAEAIDELWCSLLRRTTETAGHIAAALGLSASAIQRDDRIRERMNWPGEPAQTHDDFRREWERFGAFLDERYAARPDGRIVVVAHGGVTIDLVRTWFGDAHVRELAIGPIEHGIAPCGITRIALDGGVRTLRFIGKG